jgi:chaperone required for assembly of F1-ATPase
VEQSAETIAALEGALSGYTDLELAACHAAATLTGSAIIALALAAGRIDAAQAFAAAQLDESYQTERWGRDEEAERRSRRKFAELAAIGRLFELLRE